LKKRASKQDRKREKQMKEGVKGNIREKERDHVHHRKGKIN